MTAQAIKEDWAKLIAEDVVGELEPGEMTAKSYATEVHKAIDTGQRRLHELYLIGAATRRRVLVDGIVCYAYRLAKKAK